MKLIVSLYRVTTIRTAELLAAIGKEPETDMSGDELLAQVKAKYKPFPPRFRIFYPPDTTVNKTVVGMEALSFDIRDADVPQAGLVMVDPMSSQDVDRVDGAIESELNRLGIGTDFCGYEWRVAFSLKGN